MPHGARAVTGSQTHKTIVLTLADTGEGPPMAIRLKRLLKFALRVCSFRCVDVADVSDGSATSNANVADATKCQGPSKG
jgi:hypothetical protein